MEFINKITTLKTEYSELNLMYHNLKTWGQSLIVGKTVIENTAKNNILKLLEKELILRKSQLEELEINLITKFTLPIIGEHEIFKALEKQDIKILIVRKDGQNEFLELYQTIEEEGKYKILKRDSEERSLKNKEGLSKYISELFKEGDIYLTSDASLVI